MKFSENQTRPSRALNFVCFLLPLLSILPAAFFPQYNEALIGFAFDAISGFLAVYILLFRPPRHVRQAAWSHLVGCLATVALLIWGVYFVWSQTPIHQ